MTITLELSPQAQQRLQELAATAGQSLETYIQELIEKQVLGPKGKGPERTWQEICAPIAEAFAESAMSEDEFKDFLTEAREEARVEKRTKGGQGNTCK
jgi:predicted transcriptional regulator